MKDDPSVQPAVHPLADWEIERRDQIAAITERLLGPVGEGSVTSSVAELVEYQLRQAGFVDDFGRVTGDVAEVARLAAQVAVERLGG